MQNKINKNKREFLWFRIVLLKLCEIHTTTAHVSLKLKPDTSFLYANRSKAKLKMFFPPE